MEVKIFEVFDENNPYARFQNFRSKESREVPRNRHPKRLRVEMMHKMSFSSYKVEIKAL